MKLHPPTARIACPSSDRSSTRSCDRTAPPTDPVASPHCARAIRVGVRHRRWAAERSLTQRRATTGRVRRLGSEGRTARLSGGCSGRAQRRPRGSVPPAWGLGQRRGRAFSSLELLGTTRSSGSRPVASGRRPFPVGASQPLLERAVERDEKSAGGRGVVSTPSTAPESYWIMACAGLHSKNRPPHRLDDLSLLFRGQPAMRTLFPDLTAACAPSSLGSRRGGRAAQHARHDRADLLLLTRERTRSSVAGLGRVAVCIVESTRCPDSAAWSAVCAVSASRSSPIGSRGSGSAAESLSNDSVLGRTRAVDDALVVGWRIPTCPRS